MPTISRVAAGFALLSLLAIALLGPEARLLALLLAAALGLILTLARQRRRASVAASGGPGARRGRIAEGAGAVLEAMPEPALLADSNLTLRFRNEVCARVFGEMAPGDPLVLRFRAPAVLAAAQSAVASGEPRTVEYVERHPADRSWAIDILPVRASGASEASLHLFLFRDRTAERRTERMRTDFVANASHELRTPLSSLIGFIETLQGPARGDAAARARFLDIMREEASRMSRLIDDLLSLSRIETKRPLNAGDRTDLAEVVSVVTEMLSALAETSGVELQLEEELNAGALVAGDRDELVQVVSNLVENGCKYAASGGRMVIGLRDVEERLVEVYVRDFGPGIASRHVPRLTERFYRVEAEGPSQRTRGTGLGLSIVRNILARHGARLLVSSTPGEGSTFSFRLRRVSEQNSNKP